LPHEQLVGFHYMQFVVGTNIYSLTMWGTQVNATMKWSNKMVKKSR
jgi:hypothetical protein